jgi:hypothetical protein
MRAQAKLISGGLAVAVVALSIALGIALASDSDNDNDGMPHMGLEGDSYMGMMGAFGRMDSDEMLGMMRTVLGAEDYGEMLDHFAEHRGGMQMAHGSGIDGMMHRMMDGFFQRMPADENDLMPIAPR